MGNVYGRVNYLAEQLAMRRTDLAGKMHLGGCNPSKMREECRSNVKMMRNSNRTTMNDEGDLNADDEGSRELSPPSMRVTRSQASRAGRSSGRGRQVRRGQSITSRIGSDQQHGGRSRGHHSHRVRRSARIAGSIAAATGGSVQVMSPSLMRSHGSSSRLARVRRSMRLRQANRRPSDERH